MKEFGNADFNYDLTSQKCSFISCFLKPFILASGLLSNIALLIIVIKNNGKKVFNSQKPIRLLLIGMLLSDIIYFASSINTFFVQVLRLPDINSYNIICQFSSYISNYFIVLNECFMLIADYILFLLLFPPKTNTDIYVKYLVRHTSVKKAKDERRRANKTNRHVSSSIESASRSPVSIEFSRKNSISNVFKKSRNRLSTISVNLVNRALENQHTEEIKKYFEKHNIYAVIARREKFLVLLLGFTWLYLLSFILWTQGFKDYQLDVQGTLNNTLEYYHHFENYLSNVCKTFDFAKQFMSIYLLFLLILRLFTLFVNTAMSFTYHFKFRGDYLRTLSNTFNRKNSEWNSDTKNVRFKNFSIQYSTKFDIEKQSDGSNKKPKEISKSQQHYNHLIYSKLYAIFVMFYSFLIFPNLLMDLKNTISLSFNGHNTNSDIISNLENVLTDFNTSSTESYAYGGFGFDTMTYELDNMFLNSIHNLSHTEFDIFKTENNNSSMNLLADEKFFETLIISEFSEPNRFEFFNFLILKVAYSCKFWIYLLFSHHFKFFFSIKNRKPELSSNQEVV